MNEGDIVLIALPQADGQFKNRPALLLRKVPPFGDWLLRGIRILGRLSGFFQP